jgi:hypothetical protein
MDVNYPLYAEGSLFLLQTSGPAPDTYFVGGGFYMSFEYLVTAGGFIIHPGMEGGLNRPAMQGGLNA